jgi:cytoskeleton protein RodZ
MPPFGENLRREREMRGVTLEEISEATKISIRFLRAIENDEFGKLPGGIFTRSFILTYARYLGLDDERILGEFQLSAQPKADVDIRRIAAVRPIPKHPGGVRTPLIALLVAVVMLAGGYALFRYSRRAAEMPMTTPVPPQTTKATAPSAAQPSSIPPGTASATNGPTPGAENAGGASTTQPNTAPSVPGGSSASSAAPSAAQSSTATGPLATDTGLTLQVAATERSWVAVDADGKTVLQQTLNPNQVETFKAHNSFDVTTGNAQGIILTLNGVTLNPLGRRGEVKSIHLTRDDLKNAAP